MLSSTLTYYQLAILLYATNVLARITTAAVRRAYGTWQRNRLARQYDRIKQKEAAARQRSLQAAQRRLATAAAAASVDTYLACQDPQARPSYGQE